MRDGECGGCSSIMYMSRDILFLVDLNSDLNHSIAVLIVLDWTVAMGRTILRAVPSASLILRSLSCIRLQLHFRAHCLDS